MLYNDLSKDSISGAGENHIVAHGGLTVFTAAIFITGEMAGTGLLALPKAMNQAGWYGLISTSLLCVLSGYCGIKLGDCWTMLRQRNPAYSVEGSRSPFQVIATEGAGRVGKYVLIFVIYFQLLGASLIPWPMAIGAMACTAIACLFIMISILLDQKMHEKHEGSVVTFESFSISMGTMFFAWGGSAMFPTIQVDMKNPHRFHIAVIISYVMLLIFYLPVSIIGYIVYGSTVDDNILKSLPLNGLRYTVEILITGHLATAFTIVLNPVFQAFEEHTHIPKHFCWQRAVSRSTIVLFLALLAETIPHFGPILSFIGSSTVSILGFILPVICYVMIKRQITRMNDETFVANIIRVIPALDIFLLILSLFIGLFGAIASSYSSFADLIQPNTFVKPCWLNISAADPSPALNTTFF